MDTDESGNVRSRSLGAAAVETMRQFEAVSTLFQDSACEHRTNLTQLSIQDQLSRFRIWAGNLGALRTFPARVSLDHRLRDSPKIIAEILELLDDLCDVIGAVVEIASGNAPNRSVEAREDLNTFGDDIVMTDVGESEISEAKELFLSIKETISSLLRIAVMIRKLTPRDRYAKALARSNPFSERFDIVHVTQKYPKLDKAPNKWLRDRLGKAITQRRRFLKYAREHRQKLGANAVHAPELVDRTSTTAGSVWTTGRIPASEMGQKSLHASTSASTFVQPQIHATDFETDDIQSQTSFATSLGNEERGETVQIPSLYSVSKPGKTFECPLCWTLQTFTKEKAWRKHVFTDLRPYVCTFDRCDVKLFPSRHEWFEHEMSQHRLTWTCPFCRQGDFQEADTLLKHLQQSCVCGASDEQLQPILESSARPMQGIAASDCPFCDDWQAQLHSFDTALGDTTLHVTPNQFRRHVGSHMQSLALFAVPRSFLETDEADVDGNEEVKDATSTDMSDIESERTLTQFQHLAIIVVCLRRWVSRSVSRNTHSRSARSLLRLDNIPETQDMKETPERSSDHRNHAGSDAADDIMYLDDLDDNMMSMQPQPIERFMFDPSPQTHGMLHANMPLQNQQGPGQSSQQWPSSELSSYASYNEFLKSGDTTDTLAPSVHHSASSLHPPGYIGDLHDDSGNESYGNRAMYGFEDEKRVSSVSETGNIREAIEGANDADIGSDDSDYRPDSRTSKRRRSAQHTARAPRRRSGVDASVFPQRNSGRKARAISSVESSQKDRRSFPCVLAPYSCSSTFSSKNEWKRHVSTQHIKLGFWRCDLCAPTTDPNDTFTLYYNDFNRKDLFTQHLRRVHSPQGSGASHSKEPEHPVNEDNLQEHLSRCRLQLRHPPQQSICPIAGCDREFFGPTSWDERMEHVGRHMEKDKNSADVFDVANWKVDRALEQYLMNEDLIVWERGTWRIGDGRDPRQGDDNESDPSY